MAQERFWGLNYQRESPCVENKMIIYVDIDETIALVGFDFFGEED